MKSGIVFATIVVCAMGAGMAQVGSNAWTGNGPVGGEVNAVLVDPSSSSVLYAATTPGGVFRSSNAGATWAAANTGLFDTNTYALAADPSAAGTLYVGTDAGVFKSTDGGARWTAANNGLPALQVRALGIDPLNTTTVYAGLSRFGVYMSTDGGATWVERNQGLGELLILTLAIDPGNPQILYAGTESRQVFKSTDGAATWTRSSDGLPMSRTRVLAIDPVNPSTVFAGMSTSGVYRSLDGGATWPPSSEGLLGSVKDIVVNPNNPQIVFAATDGRGIYQSTDGGDTWTAINNGLSDQRAEALALDPAGEVLHTGTETGAFSLFLLHRMHFAQFGNGGGFSSFIMLMNPSATETATGRVELYDDFGSGLDVPLIPGVQPAGTGGAPAARFSIPPMSSEMLMTDGLGAVTPGSAIVVSDLPLGGNIEFTVPGVGMAGIAASDPLERFMVMVRNQAGGVKSGIAFLNVQNRPIRITLRLTAAGQEVPGGTAEVELPPFGHLARFVSELFPDADLDEFMGTLIGESQQGRMAVTAMDLGRKMGEFASLEVMQLP